MPKIANLNLLTIEQIHNKIRQHSSLNKTAEYYGISVDDLVKHLFKIELILKFGEQLGYNNDIQLQLQKNLIDMLLEYDESKLKESLGNKYTELLNLPAQDIEINLKQIPISYIHKLCRKFRKNRFLAFGVSPSTYNAFRSTFIYFMTGITTFKKFTESSAEQVKENIGEFAYEHSFAHFIEDTKLKINKNIKLDDIYHYLHVNPDLELPAYYVHSENYLADKFIFCQNRLEKCLSNTNSFSIRDDFKPATNLNIQHPRFPILHQFGFNNKLKDQSIFDIAVILNVDAHELITLMKKLNDNLKKIIERLHIKIGKNINVSSNVTSANDFQDTLSENHHPCETQKEENDPFNLNTPEALEERDDLAPIL